MSLAFSTHEDEDEDVEAVDGDVLFRRPQSQGECDGWAPDVADALETSLLIF